MNFSHDNDHGPMQDHPGEAILLSDKLKGLASSYATDQDRLQVLIHLTAELAEKVEHLEKRR